MNHSLNLTTDELEALLKVSSKKQFKGKRQDIWRNIYYKIQETYALMDESNSLKIGDEQKPMLYDRGKTYDSIMEIKINENGNLITMAD